MVSMSNFRAEKNKSLSVKIERKSVVHTTSRNATDNRRTLGDTNLRSWRGE